MRCMDSNTGENKTCVEAEMRKVSTRAAGCGGASVRSSVTIDFRWRAGIGHRARGFSGDAEKATEASNHRSTHHQLTAMHAGGDRHADCGGASLEDEQMPWETRRRVRSNCLDAGACRHRTRPLTSGPSSWFDSTRPARDEGRHCARVIPSNASLPSVESLPYPVATARTDTNGRYRYPSLTRPIWQILMVTWRRRLISSQRP